MAFKPLKDQNYYLIAKHSGKALGFKHAGEGNHLIQMNFDRSNQLQMFKIDLGRNHFWIKSIGSTNTYLGIENESSADGAKPKLQGWAPNAWNIRFKFIPEKDGYYRIMAVNSRKYLDVTNLSTADGAEVMQYQLMTTDNQLFSAIPVMDIAVGQDITSFSHTTDYFREGMLAFIGMTPEYGGMAKGMLNAVWKQKDEFADLWDKMKTHMDERMRALIDEVITTGLKNSIDGVFRALKEIEENTEIADKGNDLAIQLKIMVNEEASFLNSKSTKAVPYIIAYGTLLISIRFFMLVNYRALYPNDPPPSYEKLFDKANQLTKSINEYSKLINDYKALATKSRIATMEPIDHPQARLYFDGFDDWSPEIKGDMFLQHKDYYDFSMAQRKNYIGTQYPLELNELFKICKLWRCYLPKQSKDLEKISEEQSQQARNAVDSVFEKGLKEHVELSLVREAIKQAAEYTLTKEMKKDVEDACYASIDLARLESTDPKEVIKTLKKAIITVFKNTEFVRVYKKGYEEVQAIYTGKKTKKQVNVGIFGGNTTTSTFNEEGKITRINIHTNVTIVCGIEVFYDGRSTGIKGSKGMDTKELILAENEYFNSVCGYVRLVVNSIWFGTQQGRIVGEGNNEYDESAYFLGDLPDTFNARLIGISGAYDKTDIKQLSFKWEYETIDDSSLAV